MIKTLSTFCLTAALAVTFLHRPAEACLGEPYHPVEPTIPMPTSDSDSAAVATPVRLTRINVHGRLYWRALYDVGATNEGRVDGYRIVTEWACDPAGNPGADACAAFAPLALPGFDENGRPLGGWVELELAYATTSTLDGISVFGANLEAKPLEIPVQVGHRGALLLE